MPAVVLIDTNVWVSAFINPNGAPARIKQAFAKGEFQVVVSVPLLDEISDVLGHPHIRKKYELDDATIGEFLQLLSQRGRHVTPTGSLHVCRDQNDDAILETAILGQVS